MSTIDWSFYAFIVSRKLNVEGLEAWSSVLVSRVRERLGIQKRFSMVISSPILTLSPQIWITKSPGRRIIGSYPCEQTDFSRLYHKDRLHSKWNRSHRFLGFLFFSNSIVSFDSKLFTEVFPMRFFEIPRILFFFRFWFRLIVKTSFELDSNSSFSFSSMRLGWNSNSDQDIRKANLRSITLSTILSFASLDIIVTCLAGESSLRILEGIGIRDIKLPPPTCWIVISISMDNDRQVNGKMVKVKGNCILLDRYIYIYMLRKKSKILSKILLLDSDRFLIQLFNKTSIILRYRKDIIKYDERRARFEPHNLRFPWSSR